MQRQTAVGILLLVLQTAQLDGASIADFPKVFHVAGVPDVKRGQRLDISLTTTELAFTRAGSVWHVPYARIKQVLLLDAARNYEKTTMAFELATSAIGIPVGSLLILKKHKVDTVVVDYENERHGRMGLVVQMEKGSGREIAEVLRKYGVNIVDPPTAESKDNKETR